MSYGGNFRYSNFDLSIAPGRRLAHGRRRATCRTRSSWASTSGCWSGARVDKFDVIEDVQFSPRTTLMLKPSADQTIRLSYNRAYRAPSVINNYLDTTIINQLPLGSINPALGGARLQLPGPRRRQQRRPAAGGVPPQDLVEQSITAYEVGYTGVIKQRATVSAAFFFNETKDDIFFTQVASYRAANPPPGWPLPPIRLPRQSSSKAVCPPGSRRAGRPCPFGVGNGLPLGFSYRNLGKVEQKGLELGIDGAFTQGVERVCELLVSSPTRRPIGFPAVRDQPAAATTGSTSA